jgi:carboxyl-terminal processing protease
MSKIFGAISVLIVLIGVVIGGLLGRVPSRAGTSDTDAKRIVADYSDALQIIESEYGGDVDREKATDSSMQAMLWTLDPHSAFFTKEEFRKLDEDQSSQFYGIGVSILQHRDGVYVQSVIKDTPADKAGLRYGDRFLKVEDKDATQWTSAEVSKNVRGERGTPVRIEIERAGQPLPINYEITRGGVPLPSVRNVFMLNDSVGYVGLTGGFQQTTSEELNLAMTELKRLGMKSLVLDLRNNPGGILEQAVAVTSKFIEGGQTVVSVKGSKANDKRDLRATGGTVDDLPLVVMINGGSASASEIVAGAVQDYDRGLVVGSESFGKGLVQRVFRLPFGNGLTLTTARYYTPFGRSLQRDYSSGSIYDYYTHFEEGLDPETGDAPPKPAGVPVTTASGRTLFGGRGIEPDIVAPGLKPNPIRGRINEAAFFFVRQLVSGKIGGFETFRVEKQTFRQRLERGEFAVNDKLFEAFRAFAAADTKNGLTSDAISSFSDHARMRLREEIATANLSTEAGTQVLLESDPQILKAIDAMPEANKMLAALRTRSR